MLLCLLVFAPKAALGAPRRIAFVNAARDAARAQTTIDHLRPFVLGSGEWVDLGDGPARRALEAPLDPESSPESEAVARADTLLARAREAFAGFEYDTALSELRQTEVLLRGLVPHPQVIRALADMNLIEGLVRLGQGDTDRALEAFRLVRGLDPAQDTLDKGTFRPQVVALYEQAGKAEEATAKLNVTSEPAGATVWVDGQSVGPAPLVSPVAPGAHYVLVVLEGHLPRGEKVRLGQGGETSVPMLLSRLPAEEQARSVRASLLESVAPQDQWRRAAARLCDAVSVDVVVLFRQREDQQIEHAVYESKSGALSEWTFHAQGRTFVSTLPRASTSPLVVAGPVSVSHTDMLPPVTDDRTRPPPARWYRTWWGTAAIIGTVVLTTSVVLVATQPDSDPGIVVDRPTW
jgi:hypothetical protein